MYYIISVKDVIKKIKKKGLAPLAQLGCGGFLRLHLELSFWTRPVLVVGEVISICLILISLKPYPPSHY
jgi:hypothetical protein